ncbi:MAG: hypothetical protein ABWW70_00330 [Thermoproteota archaeon]
MTAARRAVQLKLRVEDVAEVLALGEVVLEHAMRTGRSHVAAASFPRHAVVLGLYEAYAGDFPEEDTYRRMTGGHRAEVREGDTYVAAALPGVSRLSAALLAAVNASNCAGGVHGATVAGGVGLIELFTSEDGEKALECVARFAGLELGPRIAAGQMLLSEYASGFRARGWRLYRFREAGFTASTRRQGYWAKLSIDVVDGYVAGYWLTGVFYAAPPMEIYDVLNSLRGALFHELALYSVKDAISRRVQLEGLLPEDFHALLDELYSAAGVRYYTA